MPVAQDPKLAIVKTATTPDGETVTKDTVISYSFEVTNTGDVPLVNVDVDDILDGTGLVWDAANPNGAVGDLAVNETKTVYATYVVTADDVIAGHVYNEATATGEHCVPGEGETPDCEEVTSPPDDEDVPVEQNPTIELTKTVAKVNGVAVTEPVTGLNVDDVVEYSIVVENTGDVPLTNVVVTDPKVTGLSCAVIPNGVLNPGDTVNCTATHTITEDDLLIGEFVNVAEVTAEHEGTLVDDDDDAKVETEPARQSLAIVKTATTPDGEDVTDGTVISYTFVVTNTGTITLNNVEVNDILDGTGLVWDAANPNGYVGTLAGEESKTVYATYVVTPNDVIAGHVYNEAIATGEGPCEGEDCDEVTSPPDDEDTPVDQDPSLAIVKTATTPEGGTVTAGTVIRYTFVVTNDGDVPLVNVSVDDILDGSGLVWAAINPNGEVGDLAVGESKTAYATYMVTPADVVVGNVHNEAIATGEHCVPGEGETSDCEEITSPPDDEDVPVAQDPSLALEKSATPDEVVKVGDIITYTFVVTNTGDVPLTKVVVDDPMLAAAGVPIPPVGDLEPGEQATVTATYAVTAADVKAGKVVNVAIAVGEHCPPDTEADCAEVTSPPDTVTVPVKKVDPTPTPTPKPQEPELVTVMPVTGNGPETGTPMLSVVLMLAALLLAGLGWTSRRSASLR